MSDQTELSFEQFWDQMLSREEKQVLQAFKTLDPADQTDVLAHLQKMASEEGWHPEQRISALAALRALKFHGMDLNALSALMHQFVSDKGWYAPGSIHPQTPRNIALSLSIEASEVLEHFQWLEQPSHPEELASELADVTLYLLQLASLCKIDLEQAVFEKLQKNYQRDWKSPQE